MREGKAWAAWEVSVHLGIRRGMGQPILQGCPSLAETPSRGGGEDPRGIVGWNSEKAALRRCVGVLEALLRPCDWRWRCHVAWSDALPQQKLQCDRSEQFAGAKLLDTPC